MEAEQTEDSAFRFSDLLPPFLRLATVAELLGVEPERVRSLVRSGQFPCEVMKMSGKYVVPVVDVMAAMGIEDPSLYRSDLKAGAEFAARCDIPEE